ncbi:MAG TPA: GNAT family N-acetyltransferase [Mycobacteriales bacterium]|nr:GNAT family N-acetyltransferase [Mycobacteriales bacterium]
MLDDRDLDAARAVLDQDPVTNVFVASRVDACGLDSRRLGAEVWGYGVGGHLRALCYAGANLVPAGADEVAARAFAERARRQGRHCSSIVGPIDAVDTMWAHLRGSWGTAREVRRPQPHLAIGEPPHVPADPDVRRVGIEELDVLLPACVAMFTEEVGVSPTTGDGGALYRARVAELISDGRSFARIEDGRVLFKAEVGAATSAACQVQGVWVDPELRGQGLGTAGTAAVVDLARATVAPTVSLYVNDFNVVARAAYERVGFREIGAFASVLF